MRPSEWAEYLSMVAEMTNERTSDIWEEMDIVQGLHFVALWWHKQKIQTLSLIGSRGAGIDTIL